MGTFTTGGTCEQTAKNFAGFHWHVFRTMPSQFAIVSVGPVLACMAGIIYAACVSGNPILVAISVFVVPFVLALIASPFVHEYMELKKRHSGK